MIHFAIRWLRELSTLGVGGMGAEVVNHGLWSATFDNSSPSPELLLHHLVIYNHRALLRLVDLCIPPDLQFISTEASAASLPAKCTRPSWICCGKFQTVPLWNTQLYLFAQILQNWCTYEALCCCSRAGVWTRSMGCVRPSRRPSTRLFRRLWISWRKTRTLFVPQSAADYRRTG